MRFIVPSLSILPAFALLAGCPADAPPRIVPLGPQSVAVHETLRVPLRVENGAGGDLSFDFDIPELPRETVDGPAGVSGGAAGGEFRWTPLVSHVGTHEVQIILLDDGDEVDRAPMVVTVTPAEDAAPLFLSPSAGGTFDLERDPCVQVDVQVRDNDSREVVIGTRSEPPEGAQLVQEGPKEAVFEWCPSPDQVAASERWTIALSADDGDHPPTELDYVIVLRSGTKEGCPGEAPRVTITSPAEDSRLRGSPSFPVTITVEDDQGLRDAPLLYYSTSAPDDPAKPDVTAFSQVTFAADGGAWHARIPDLGLAEGEERTIYLVASATDNDDETGTLCDHRTDTPLHSFLGVGGVGAGDVPACERCGASSECQSGVCANSAMGGRCLESCAGGSACGVGSCGLRVTVEGSTAQACGNVLEACGGSGTCSNDGREPDDSLDMANAYIRPISDGKICGGDEDWFRVEAEPGTEVAVVLDGFRHADGDLDLQVLDSGGRILASSAGSRDMESARQCLDSTGSLYARVFGFLDAENGYELTVEPTGGSCCVDDPNEQDDTLETARVLSGTAFDGRICPGDDDYLTFYIDEPSRVDALILFDPEVGDLDLELYAPDGSLADFSRGVTDTESIETELTEPGSYVLRVYGYGEAAGPYLGELEIASAGGCSGTASCPSGTVCRDGACGDDSCTRAADCPSGHECPLPGPDAVVSHCGAGCAVNSDCRTSEACKWFPSGRYCGTRGSGGNGAGCGTFADCGGQRACLAWPGGYCARAGCTGDADCESGTRCVETDAGDVCAVSCFPGEGTCRGGYACERRTAPDGDREFVCVPS